MQNDGNISGSFRDPSGSLFCRNGTIYRQVNRIYKEEYDHLMRSNLYKTLVDRGLLISHEEIDAGSAKPEKVYKVIKPEKISFISYPYEWCFSQLKNAALTTLKIQKISLEFGMSLKDSSAYNIQFKKGKPVLIDTLSFQKYRQGRPWVAYRQFCQHFLAPLALMAYTDIQLSQLLRVYMDGVPLGLASKLLPFYTHFAPSLLIHIHTHAKCQKYFAGKTVNRDNCRTNRLAFLGLIDNLESALRRLKWQPKGTEWADYYDNTKYSIETLKQKKQIVAQFLDKINPKTVWDLGANTGMFSRIAGSRGIEVISFDIDPAATEKNYLECLAKDEADILPLLLDLNNPSPGIGWENRERTPLLERGPADTVFALALIHHLAISNNLPLDRIAGFFNKICSTLIIEFIPKSDPQAQRLLSGREDGFFDYTQSAFENDFEKYFEIKNAAKLKETERVLYLMRKKNA